MNIENSEDLEVFIKNIGLDDLDNDAGQSLLTRVFYPGQEHPSEGRDVLNGKHLREDYDRSMKQGADTYQVMLICQCCNRGIYEYEKSVFPEAVICPECWADESQDARP